MVQILNSDVLVVGVIMGSQLDWFVMEKVCVILDEFGVVYVVKVVFVYCILEWLYEYVIYVKVNGLKVIIVGVGGVVYLFGMMVLMILFLVFGVLVQFCVLSGMDSLFLIVQMLKGILVGILVIGDVGVVNVGLFVVLIIVLENVDVVVKFDVFCV